MATLEKIRSKSVLLLIIIAVALLAFIAGDFLTSSRSIFGTGTTIAKVDGQKIDVNEFQRRLEEANQRVQQSGQKIDGSELQQQVLQQMIAEKLMQAEYDRLGLVVTDQELNNAMFGENSAYFNQMVASQYGVDATTLRDMAYNPSKYEIEADQAARLRDTWLELERSVEQSLLSQKFQSLFQGTLVANNLDAQALYDDNNSTSAIAFTRKPFASLSDDDYAVTDEEINEYYRNNRNRFRLLEPTRLVDYVFVDIVPSAADIQNGRQRIEQALEGLRTQEGTQGLEGMTDMIAERKAYAYSGLTPALKGFVDSAAVGHAAAVVQQGTTFQLAKLLGKSAQVDSVNVSFLAVQGTRAEIDSIINAYNSGATFASLAENPNVAQSQDSMWISLIDPAMAQVKEMMTNNAVGVAFTPDTIEGSARIFRINTRKAPVTTYDLAVINYDVEPSAATINTLESDLARFLNENNNATDFKANAEGAGYTLATALVTPSNGRLGNLDDTRNVIAWAHNAKKGQVSGVMGDETTGRYVAAALEDIYNDGFAPATNPSVREFIINKVRKAKKGEALVAQYKGKASDLAGYAALMEAPVDSTNVSFGQIFIPNFGPFESALAAAVATAQPGQLVGPLATNDAVVVFTVNSVDNSGRPFDADEQTAAFNQQRGAGALARNLMNILRQNANVKNNSLTFYNGGN